MYLSDLIQPNLITLNGTFTDPKSAILAMAEQLYKEGHLHDQAQFIESVLAREAQGPTALLPDLAIPHGKSNSVKKLGIAAATLKNPILWDGLDGPEQVRLIFLLAVPEADAGTTHLKILKEITQKLSNSEIREQLIAANCDKSFLDVLTKSTVETQVIASLDHNRKTIVCVTACPAGIAHTYMAAQALEKAGAALGVNIIVEKQGSLGIEDPISAEQMAAADACIFAVDVAVKNIERFAGIPLIKTSVAKPLKYADEIVKDALEAAKQGRDTTKTVSAMPEEKLALGQELKQALLTGISFAVPLIVAGGTVLAFAVLISQIFGLQAIYDTENSWLWMYRKLGGGLLGTLMVPVLSAYVAYSIADKPALAPGFAAGLAANMISSGFLGGIVGGLLAGYLMRYIKKTIRVSPTFNGFLSFYLYPVLGTLIVGSLMMFVVGAPVAALNNGLIAWLNSLSGSNVILLGAILGAMVSFDLGGPVNKAAYVFCLGAMADGVFLPYAIFASVKMVSAFTVTLVTVVAPKLFKDFEIELGKSTWLLGLAGITEGAIPMAIEDPIRVLTSFIVGSAVTGGLVAVSGIGLSTPGAGIFSLFLLLDGGIGALNAAAIWFFAAIIGTIISSIMLISWRKMSYKAA
ncbi:2-O-a-mannosyl-D-glycerate specific PTS enzyme IIABC component [Gammaproteobacteria bacterium]|nr:2-O-a-mannosyl-D-glycerate specific PTS enzyme IIABC component [Gammaproteobacteria bacterium]